MGNNVIELKMKIFKIFVYNYKFLSKLKMLWNFHFLYIPIFIYDIHFVSCLVYIFNCLRDVDF